MYESLDEFKIKIKHKIYKVGGHFLGRLINHHYTFYLGFVFLQEITGDHQVLGVTFHSV
jgi:hypothetical protein